MDSSSLYMDHDAVAMDAVPSYASFSPQGDSEDHVRWQGSQTACLALNQLIKSSAREPSMSGDASSSTRGLGWQRQSSFDQIPGFSHLTTSDANGSPSGSSSTRTHPAYPKPHSSVRPSVARRSPTVAPDLTSFDLNSPIPFFDKSNPAQFLDILKGVSARLDENARMKKKDSAAGPLGSDRPLRTKKRARPVSLGGASSEAKKGRVGVLQAAVGDYSGANKGKARAVSGDEMWNLRSTDMRRSTSAIPQSFHSPGYSDESSMEIDDSSRETSRSQVQMPPPPAPAPIKHSTSTNRAHISHHSSNEQSLLPSNPPRNHLSVEPKPQKPDPIPKLHPLLVSSITSTSTIHSRPQALIPLAVATSKPQPQVTSYYSKPLPNAHFNNKSRPQVQVGAAVVPPSSSNPCASSSQSSRPPVLGMRRTHTHPTRTSVPSGPGIQGNTTSGGIPTKQKGFKPPLLSSQAAVVKEEPIKEEPVAFKLGQPTSCAGGSNRQKSGQYIALKAPSGSNGSATSTSSKSSTSSAYTSGADAVFDSKKSLKQHGQTSVAGAPPRPASPVMRLPEPSDADPDSSFGDMSFDMDALEETMKMYD